MIFDERDAVLTEIYPHRNHAISAITRTSSSHFLLHHHPLIPPLSNSLSPLLIEPTSTTLLVPRLTSIRPPPLRLLIPTHARAHSNIHPRRRREAKALCHLGQIQLIHVKHGAQRVRRVRVQIGTVAVLGALVEVVVLVDELLEQGLDVGDLVGREVELDDGHAGLLEVRQEADLAGLEEHEGAALAVGAAGGPADAVDVVARVVWGVDLDDPVYCGDLRVLLVHRCIHECVRECDLHPNHEQQRRCR